MCCNWTFGRKVFLVYVCAIVHPHPFPLSVPNITFQNTLRFSISFKLQNWKCFSFIVLCVNTRRQVSLYQVAEKKKEEQESDNISFGTIVAWVSARLSTMHGAYTYWRIAWFFSFDFRNFICLHFENHKNELPEANMVVSVYSRRWLISVRFRYFLLWLSSFDF